MRIAIVTDAWHPQVNGVVTTLSRTVAILREAGHEVMVIQPWLFKTFPCPTYPEIRLSLFPGRKIGKILDAFAPDAIHIATEGFLGWAARSYCRNKGLRFTTSYTIRVSRNISGYGSPSRYASPMAACAGFTPGPRGPWWSPMSCGPSCPGTDSEI